MPGISQWIESVPCHQVLDRRHWGAEHGHDPQGAPSDIDASASFETKSLVEADRSGLLGLQVTGRPGPSLRRLLRRGVDLSLLRLGPVGLWRQLAVDRRVRSLHGRIPPPQHWYVWAIGVDPVHQGRGTGRQLLAPILQSADDAGPLWSQATTHAGYVRCRENGAVAQAVTQHSLVHQRQEASPLSSVRRHKASQGGVVKRPGQHRTGLAE